MIKYSLFPRSLFWGSIALILVVLACPAPASAGFQWTPPAAADAGLASAPASSDYASQPIIIQGQPSQPSSPTLTKAPQTLQLPAEPARPQETPGFAGQPASGEHVLMPPPAASKMEAPSGQEVAVQGFANNVPLAVALRQILPSEYGYSVAQDVPLSTLVSWKGGRPWRSTLEDMLRDVGLGLQEQGNMVKIVRVAKEPSGTLGAVAPQPPSPPRPSLPAQPAGKPMALTPPPASQVLMPPQNLTQPESMMPVPMAGMTSGMAETWTANRGETLHKALETWCRRANIDLSWQAEYDFPIQATVTLTGSFEDAVRGLLVGFQEAQPQPTASLHNNPAAGQAVLVVQVRGNDYNE